MSLPRVKAFKAERQKIFVVYTNTIEVYPKQIAEKIPSLFIMHYFISILACI